MLICILELVRMWTFLVVFFIFVLLICLLDHVWKRPRLYPPGPSCLPVLGNLLSVILKLRKEKYAFKVWQSWARQYGELLGLRLGVVNVVVVFSRELIKEVSSREAFQGRPDGFFYTMRSFGKKLGIVFADGPRWVTTRRFVLKYLKNFGYNTRFMENYIEEECRALIELRMKDAGQPVPVNTMFQVSIVNILWRLVAGKRYNLCDERLQRLCNLITRLFKAVDMSGGILNSLPYLRHVAPNLIGYTQLKSIHNEIHSFIKETIKEHQESLDLNHPGDVIDALLIEMIECDEPYFTMEDLQVVCLDLLEAGMETVSNTAVFMLLYISRDQDVQRRLHREIFEVIGHARLPSVNDRAKVWYPPIRLFDFTPKEMFLLMDFKQSPNEKAALGSLQILLRIFFRFQRMVYTEAVMLETLRLSSVAPVGIPHMALEDAQLGNYIIPKGTFLLLGMHDLHNGEHWKDPDVFRPDRFLTKDGNILQDDRLMPFGAGKRRCIGEGLARTELFMFLTHILQRFYLELPKGEPLPPVDPNDGLSLSAKPFRLIFNPRY